MGRDRIKVEITLYVDNSFSTYQIIGELIRLYGDQVKEMVTESEALVGNPSVIVRLDAGNVREG